MSGPDFSPAAVCERAKHRRSVLSGILDGPVSAERKIEQVRLFLDEADSDEPVITPTLGELLERALGKQLQMEKREITSTDEELSSMFSVVEERERCAAICDDRAALNSIHDDDTDDFAAGMIAGCEECADLIRVTR